MDASLQQHRQDQNRNPHKQRQAYIETMPKAADHKQEQQGRSQGQQEQGQELIRCPTPTAESLDSTSRLTRHAEAELLTRFRRDLHRIPELGFELPQTIAYVTRSLEKTRDRIVAKHGEKACTVFSPCKSTVCMFFNRESTHTTAIRSDMDALPVTEATMTPYSSQHAGRMHACGHDGHMSMVLGLAHWLASCFDELPRNVLLVFQPAEEVTGGARIICESGVFEHYNTDRIFGFHLWPDLPAGQIASRPGALLAAANEVTATFYGKSSHIAKASEGADALDACVRFCQDSYAYIAQREMEEPCLLKFGRMEAGTVRNAIASHAVIEGSLRTFSTQMGQRCRRELSELAQRRANEAGCTCEVCFSDGYPPVINDAQLYEMAACTLAEADKMQEKTHRNENATLSNPTPALAPVELPAPLLIAEDFSFYQRHLPGVFLLLGTGTGIPLHADTFDFDESILRQGLSAYKVLVMIG